MIATKGPPGLLLAFLLLLAAGCVTANPRDCRQVRGADVLDSSAFVAVVDHAAARQRLLASGDSPPGVPEEALAAWFETEWSAFIKNLPAGATIYWFKESKGALGYRQGLVAIRGCRVLRSVGMVEDH
ncbi:MAG: hypothetical protein SF066_02855 [Thermoanaerobaculia bacterium]|nr:hypothetical protein [Thermoanaerobaculia bacterium]